MNHDPIAHLKVCVWCGGEGRVSVTKTNTIYRGCKACEKFSYPARTRQCRITTNNKTGEVVSLDWEINEPGYPNYGVPDAPSKEPFLQAVRVTSAKAWAEVFDSENPGKNGWMWTSWCRPLPDPKLTTPIATQIQEIIRNLKQSFNGSLSELQKEQPCPKRETRKRSPS